MYYKTHKGRYSDSSQYDEVCTVCGLTDSSYAEKNMDNTPCTQKQETDSEDILS